MSASSAATVMAPARISRRFRPALRIWLSVAAVLLASEFGVRWLLRHSAQDEQHVREIPQIAARLGRAQGLRVLFLGNSLTRTNLNMQSFGEALTVDYSGRVSVERVFPDDSKIAEWYYAFKHHFVRSHELPDVLVIGFAAQQMEDSGKLEPARFATAFGGLANSGELFQNDITEFGSRVEFFLASVSAAFANREKVKNRLLASVIPHYEQTALRVNRALRESNRGGQAKPTYRRLERLLSLASQHRVRVVFVSMPQPAPYPVDEGLLSLVRDRGADYVDGRTVDGLVQLHFTDGYHLGPEGAQLFSRALAMRLSGLVRSIATSRVVATREGTI